MGAKPLLVGVSGQVGSQLLHLVGAENCIATSRRPEAGQIPLDLAALASVDDAERSLGSLEIDAIYCIAGLTAVDYCEDVPEVAFATNCRGPEMLAKVAAKRDIPYVYFSTEYVFDGYDGPYAENDTANPLSVYGKSKWEGELAVLAACGHALVLRTTVVYGQDYGQKNYVYSLMRLLSAGKTMRVPEDQISTPSYNRDLARATVGLVERRAKGIYHVCGPERMDRMEFARGVAGFLGLDTELLVGMSTAALGQKAVRPLAAGMSTEKLVGEFPELRMRGLVESLEDCRGELEEVLRGVRATATA
jgi:dTDP-4-dehydrorhamnose reductase